MINKKEVIEHFGSGVNLAKALGISQQAVSAWDKEVPELQIYRIWRICSGKVKDQRKYMNKKFTLDYLLG